MPEFVIGLDATLPESSHQPTGEVIGRGETPDLRPLVYPYCPTVRQGVRWVVSAQRPVILHLIVNSIPSSRSYVNSLPSG